MNFIEDVERLAELRNRGLLNEDEFQQKKADMLGAGRAGPLAGIAAPAAPPARGDALDIADKLLIEQRVANEMPSQTLAYVLWFFTSLIGGHRFYLGRAGSAVGMLVLTITLAGLIITIPWAFIDLFRIPRLVRERTDLIRDRLTLRAL